MELTFLHNIAVIVALTRQPNERQFLYFNACNRILLIWVMVEEIHMQSTRELPLQAIFRGITLKGGYSLCTFSSNIRRQGRLVFIVNNLYYILLYIIRSVRLPKFLSFRHFQASCCQRVVILVKNATLSHFRMQGWKIGRREMTSQKSDWQASNIGMSENKSRQLINFFFRMPST